MSEWNGEGIPPVGTVCEATWGEKNAWLKAVILEHAATTLFAAKFEDWWLAIKKEYARNAEFRPIQSEEQRQVAEIARIIDNNYPAEPNDLAQEIFNAGFRKEISDGR